MASMTDLHSRYSDNRRVSIYSRTSKHVISPEPSFSVSHIKRNSLSMQSPAPSICMRDPQSNSMVHTTIRTPNSIHPTVRNFHTPNRQFSSQASSDISSMKFAKHKIEPVNITKIYRHQKAVATDENNISPGDGKLSTNEIADQFKKGKVGCQRCLICGTVILLTVLLFVGIIAALLILYMIPTSTTILTTVISTTDITSASTTTISTITTSTTTTSTVTTSTSTTSTTTTSTSTTSTTTTSTSTTSTSTTSTSTTSTSTTSTTTTSTTTTSTTTTSTAFLPLWNDTGVTLAGSTVGTSGATPSLFTHPYNLAFDSSNALYITDYNGNRIQKWIPGASTGITVAGQANGASGASSTMLSHPVGVILDSNNNMYFSDRGNNRVMFWPYGASNGTVIAGFTGSSGNALNQFNNPSALVRNETTGTLYIADTSNHRIMCYLFNATSGTVVAGGNGQGTSSTQLNDPYDFVWDAATDSFIIVNYGAHNVVRWVFGASSWTLLAGVTGTSGSTSTLLWNPLSIVLDPYGNMYVSDTTNHRIQLFLAGESNGTTIAGITGSSGTAANQLNTPYWAILDSQLNLYVADTYNHRIQMFSRY